MNINQMKYFQAVCEYGSVLKASEVLHISQPSVSAAIKALEDEFGCVLFTRQHKGMVLTDEGRKFLTLSHTVTDPAEKVSSIMMDFGKKRHKLRLGVPPMAGSIILPGLFRDFCLLHPDIDIEITESGRFQLKDMLDGELLDLVFVSHVESLDPEYSSVLITSLEYGCVVGRNHYLTSMKVISLEELEKQRLVMAPESYYHSGLIRHRFAEKQITPNVILRTSQIYSLLRIIRNSNAVGFLFRDLVRKHDGIAFIPLENPVFVRVSLAWKKRSYRYADMNALIDYVKKTKLAL